MSGTILLIEDNADSGNSMTWLLEEAGYYVRIAQNGINALEITKDYIPDVIISDIMMPGINGYEVCMAMKANPRLSKSRFIAYTGWSSHERKRLAMQAGFDCHLVKATDMKALLQIVHNTVESKQ